MWQIRHSSGSFWSSSLQSDHNITQKWPNWTVTLSLEFLLVQNVNFFTIIINSWENKCTQMWHLDSGRSSAAVSDVKVHYESFNLKLQVYHYYWVMLLVLLRKETETDTNEIGSNPGFLTLGLIYDNNIHLLLEKLKTKLLNIFWFIFTIALNVK